MTADSLGDALVHARSLLVDLERHIDRAASERDLAEVGRAWVRVVQVERLLRDLLPADVTRDTEIPDPSRDGGPSTHDAAGGDTPRGR